ncbi:TRZ/ATZ family hydrolase [Zeimonas arvi]|uniref:TRZ/ATZ family hydrolase n=1 Tax=Zeimonas arvi TaxID=2498847 RepID=A0A5C8P4P3_9BURK|nr:TRZ/ATZ family hydrolase [Zeimonas arvi]TXL68288.1 TRZ/ATZ family hydrolase [Zeimonas arvi]
MPEAVILAPQWIAPVAPDPRVLTGHAVLVEDGRIAELAPFDGLRERHPDVPLTLLPGQLLVPGFVNLHTHAAMSLLRGVADDLPLHDWLRKRIWPLEGKLVSRAFVRDGALLAAHEMLMGGTTCFNDMYFFPEEAVAAARQLGMRSMQGIIVIEFPSAYASDAGDYLRKGLELRDRHRDDPMVGFCLAPHAPYTVSDETLKRVAVLARELGLPIHTHVHETAAEIEESQSRHGKRPLQRLDALGLLGPELIAVHAVHLDDNDLRLLATAGASVAHCPHSNLKLASGIAPVARMIESGIRVGIGTDGSASNNRLDLLQEARTAALLAKGSSGQADAWPAARVLRALTLDAAAALGLDDRIGSIEAGKRADLVAVDLSAPELSPVFDPVSQLVYAAGREHVQHVWIDGRHVVRKRQLTDDVASEAVSELVGRTALWHNRTGEILSG